MSEMPALTRKPLVPMQAAWWLLLAGYFALGLATLTDTHRWGDDWAQYVMHARNLASGHPYADIGYLFNPDSPRVGPATYPPGFPMLLAPLVAVFGTHLAALKVVGLACIVASLPLAFRVMASVTGAGVALAGLGLLALHPRFWQLRQVIESDAPYMFFSLVALWWCTRRDAGAESAGKALLEGVVLGVLLYLCVLQRTIAITLLPAIAVYGWAQRRHLAWFGGAAITLVLFVWLQSTLFVAPPTYQAEMHAPTARTFSAKPRDYVTEIADLLPLPLGLSPIAAILLMVATLAGAWAVFRRAGRDPGANGGLRGVAARVPLVVWYLGSYTSAIMIASVAPDSRLLIPLLPIVFPLAALGVHATLQRFPQVRVTAAIATAGVVAYFVLLNASGRFAPNEQRVTCPSCAEMFAFVREQTAPGSVIVFNKPRVMALLGARRSWAASYHYSPEQLERALKRTGTEIAVEGVSGSEFARRFPPARAVQQRMSAPGARVLFRNDDFIVVRLAPL